MVGVYIVFFVLCLVGGYSVYLLILQRFLAYEVAKDQGHKVFFLLSLIFAIVLFYTLVWLLGYLTNLLADFHLNDTLVGIATVSLALLSGLLSVLFWKSVLAKKKN